MKRYSAGRMKLVCYSKMDGSYFWNLVIQHILYSGFIGRLVWGAIFTQQCTFVSYLLMTKIRVLCSIGRQEVFALHIFLWYFRVRTHHNPSYAVFGLSPVLSFHDDQVLTETAILKLEQFFLLVTTLEFKNELPLAVSVYKTYSLKASIINH